MAESLFLLCSSSGFSGPINKDWEEMQRMRKTVKRETVTQRKYFEDTQRRTPKKEAFEGEK